MRQQKRRGRPIPRRTAAAKNRAKPRSAARRAVSRTSNRRASAARITAAQKWAAEIFAQQIHSVWSRFQDECKQFAEGFNNEIGSHQLHVEPNPDTVVIRYAVGGEVLVQLDRDQKQIDCWISSQCGDFGSCIVEQPTIGFTVEDGRLRLTYGAASVTEGDLAVKLLTRMTQTDAPADSTAVNQQSA